MLNENDILTIHASNDPSKQALRGCTDSNCLVQNIFVANETNSPKTVQKNELIALAIVHKDT